MSLIITHLILMTLIISLFLLIITHVQIDVKLPFYAYKNRKGCFFYNWFYRILISLYLLYLLAVSWDFFKFGNPLQFYMPIEKFIWAYIVIVPILNGMAALKIFRVIKSRTSPFPLIVLTLIIFSFCSIDFILALALYDTKISTPDLKIVYFYSGSFFMGVLLDAGLALLCFRRLRLVLFANG